jgi:isopenicillin-N epimerase
MQVSWGWHHDRRRPDDRDDFGSTPRLRALEFEGTRDPCPWLVVPTAIDFVERLGLEQIRRRMAQLAAHARERLSGHCGLEPATPSLEGLRGALTAFRIPNDVQIPWWEIRQRFWERGIEIPIVERPDRLLLRVSSHFYNTPTEIDRLADSLPEVFHGGQP